MWAPTSTPGSHTCSPCLTSTEVRFASRQIYFRHNINNAFSTFNPLLEPIPNTPQLYQSLASLPTSNSTDETDEEVVIRHVRFLHYENSGNLKTTAAPLSLRSGDRCPSGALSLNGATSLSSGTLWSIYVPYLLPLVALCQHFYCTAATLKFPLFFVFNLWFASITWIVLCGVVGYVRPLKKKKQFVKLLIWEVLCEMHSTEGKLFCSVRGDGKPAMKPETTESCNIHTLGRKGSAFLREEVPVCFSTFVFQKRNKLNVTKCHWFGISVLINKPRRRSWGIVGGNIWTNQRQTQLRKVTCVYVSPRLCRHMKTTFLFLGCLLSRRLWQGWTDSLDKDTSAPETKRCGWSVNNEPWRTEAAYSLVLWS